MRSFKLQFSLEKVKLKFLHRAVLQGKGSLSVSSVKYEKNLQPLEWILAFDLALKTKLQCLALKFNKKHK